MLAAAVVATAGCNGDMVPIDPRDDAPLGYSLPVDEEIRLSGLDGPVDAVRDEWGRTHIYATTVHDAMLAQGYLVARDRHLQLDFYRRVASGRLAEVLGALDPSLVEMDIGFRQLGLHRVAKEIYERSDGEARAILEAYASGVSQLYAELQAGTRAFPEGIQFYEPQHLTPWEPADCLTMGRLQSWLLSYEDDTPNQELLDDLQATFRGDDADPAVALRAGIERDYLRFGPPDHATVIPSLDDVGVRSLELVPARRAPVAAAALARGERYRAALERARRWFAPSDDFGSNNWAIAGVRSKSGRALLASDPHLSLSSPAVFWPVAIHVAHRPPAGPPDGGPPPRDLHVNGLAFAGIPGVILGHNENVAWGATVTGYDVTDIYAEELTSDGSAVVFEGREVALETVEERILDGNGGEVIYPLQIVPHHGPIVPTIVGGQVQPPDPAVGALSVRWTGFEPTADLDAITGLMYAADVDEARAALEAFAVGSQNWMLADTSGNILWTSHSLVPYRDEAALAWHPETYSGLLPCLVLPGDGTAEWKGYWADDAVPWAKNPGAGYLATANNDQVGGTLDNDPSNDRQRDGKSGYLACAFDPGFRQGRIQERIEGHGAPLDLDDLAAIQGDHRSPLGARLVPQLLVAIENAELQRTAGGFPDLAEVVADPGYDAELVAQALALLEAWGSAHDYAAASGIAPDDNQPLLASQPEAQAAQATLLFNAWLVRFLPRVFADELARVGRPNGSNHYVAAIFHLLESDPAALATYDAATGDSALWDDLDTPAIESRQERMVRALLDALAWLGASAGPVEGWRWGAFHTITFEALAPVFNLAIPSPSDDVFTKGFPRHGDMHNVDACHYSLRRPLDGEPDFSYGSGPAQRFVIELEPGAVRARNALPGGAVWDKASPHFADEAELWRRNQTHPLPFYLDEVLAAAETRAILRSD